MAGSEDDGMASGSLFEGMVLFNLSSSPPPPPLPPPIPEPQSLPPTTDQQPQPQPQPLDEDLFSDLTLQTLDPQSPVLPAVDSTPPPPEALLATTARVPSRKKKRAVRIGYARQDHDHDQDQDPPQTLTLTPTKDAAFPPPSPPASEDRCDSFPVETLVKDEVASPSSPPETLTKDEILDEVVKEQPSSDSDSIAVDIEGRLEVVRTRILRKVEGIREKAGVLSAKRKELGRRRRNAMEKVNLAGEEYRELERELEEAVEAEDFERAERVSESVAEKEKEKDGLVGELRKMEIECDEVDAEMQVVLECLIAAEEEGATLLEEFGKV